MQITELFAPLSHSSRLHPGIFLSILFSNTTSLLAALEVRYRANDDVNFTYNGTYCHTSVRLAMHLRTSLLRVPHEECARLRDGVPYVKVYRYNPKHLCPKLNVYGDNGQRKVWSSGGSTHCTCQLTTLSMSVLECGVILREFRSSSF